MRRFFYLTKTCLPFGLISKGQVKKGGVSIITRAAQSVGLERLSFPLKWKG